MQTTGMLPSAAGYVSILKKPTDLLRQDRKAVATIATTTTAFLVFEGVSEESEDDEHFLPNAVGVITGPVQ